MATTTNFGWETPDDTDLVKDGAAAIRTSLNGVDASFVDLKGGTTGQILSKASGTDLDFAWVAADDTNAIQNAIMDAKGDIIAATAADTPARVAVGTNGQVLTADSTAAAGVKWASAPAGKVLQVLSANKTDTLTTTSSTFADLTGLSLTITPTSSTSKIFIIFNVSVGAVPNSSGGVIRIMRDTTPLSIGDTASTRPRVTTGFYPGDITGANNNFAGVGMQYLDSPATTSATTYKLQFASTGSGTAYVNRTNGDRDGGTYDPRMASTITIMEIGA